MLWMYNIVANDLMEAVLRPGFWDRRAVYQILYIVLLGTLRCH